MNFLVCKGITVAELIMTIFLVIFIYGGIVLLLGAGKGEREVQAPAKITVTTGEVTDHNLQTSVKVTVEGKKDRYYLSMTGPEGTEVGSESIDRTQMADEKQSVWISLVGFKREVAAKPGAYSLLVTDSNTNKVYEKTFGPYSGSDLSIINISSITTSHTVLVGYWIDEIAYNVKNDGDLPGYTAGGRAEVKRKKGPSTIPKEDDVVLPGKTATISSEFDDFGPFGEGNYTATIKLKEEFLGGKKFVATYSTMISLPYNKSP